MTIETLIDYTSRLQGNLKRGRSLYISVSNMDYFADQLSGIDAKQGILITPYLIVNDGSLYELHYYEFDVEVRGDKSYFTDYNKNNTLPIEITEKLKPQAIVAVGDANFYNEAVNEYLSNMKTMRFAEDKEHYPQLQSAKLFYQIFIDSDLH